MQIRDRALPVANSALSTLIKELGSDCQNVTALLDSAKFLKRIAVGVNRWI
jgi:hypothetical protein